MYRTRAVAIANAVVLVAGSSLFIIGTVSIGRDFDNTYRGTLGSIFLMAYASVIHCFLVPLERSQKRFPSLALYVMSMVLVAGLVLLGASLVLYAGSIRSLFLACREFHCRKRPLGQNDAKTEVNFAEFGLIGDHPTEWLCQNIDSLRGRTVFLILGAALITFAEIASMLMLTASFVQCEWEQYARRAQRKGRERGRKRVRERMRIRTQRSRSYSPTSVSSPAHAFGDHRGANGAHRPRNAANFNSPPSSDQEHSRIRIRRSRDETPSYVHRSTSRSRTSNEASACSSDATNSGNISSLDLETGPPSPRSGTASHGTDESKSPQISVSVVQVPEPKERQSSRQSMRV